MWIKKRVWMMKNLHTQYTWSKNCFLVYTLFDIVLYWCQGTITIGLKLYGKNKKFLTRAYTRNGRAKWVRIYGQSTRFTIKSFFYFFFFLSALYNFFRDLQTIVIANVLIHSKYLSLTQTFSRLVCDVTLSEQMNGKIYS